MEKNIWGIHTTDDKLFLSGNVIALGWKRSFKRINKRSRNIQS